jgi:hypothetical protein
MDERSGRGSAPSGPTPTPDEAPGPPPTSETVGGKTRAESEAMKRRGKGDARMEAHRGTLDKSWESMVVTFGD